MFASLVNGESGLKTGVRVTQNVSRKKVYYYKG